ncbi:MAG: VCBS repeat-containing protein [Actinomycetota bacterium]
MKIASANLQMASTHAASQHHEIRESLRMWVGSQRPDFEGRGRVQTPASQVQISDTGKAAQAADKDRDALDGDPRLLLLKTIIEALTGREIKLLSAQDINQDQQPVDLQDPNQPATRPAGYGVEYDYHESYSETETTTFAAAGTVRTADGKDIQFKIDLTMARSYAEESNVSLRLGDAVRRKDPLVLNFAGTAAQLTDARFRFDLDADGQAEQINFVRPGSGFLVFDRNRDGKATDGSELFGPATGNGFAELAKLDEDRNGWIDENDSAYKDLAIWIKDAEGKDQLKSLQEAQVGAISLARVATPFDIKDDANRMQGQVRDSGVFLQEDGKAGTIQQIDLTV